MTSYRITSDYLMKEGFKNCHLMKWPACSPDLTQLRTCGAFCIGRCMKVGGFSTKNESWEALLESVGRVSYLFTKNIMSIRL